MNFALLTVSYSGLFYKGEALSVDQQIIKAKKLGFDALAIETKRPIASPIDLSKSKRKKIRDIAASEDITLCAIESMSNFASQYMEERENNLAMMRSVLELATDLGVDLVKVFAAWPGIINDEEEIAIYAKYERSSFYNYLNAEDLRNWERAVEGIKEVAGWAADFGITIALQNHGPVIRPGYEDALAMIQEINRENVKLCLDVPLFDDRQSDEYVCEAVKRCKEHIVHTHYGAWNFSETDEGIIVQDPSPTFGAQINYRTFIEELQKINYSGYLVSEYCLPVIKNHRIAGIEEIDHATSISLKYIKQLVNQYDHVKV